MKTIEEANLEGTALLRVDINSPVENGKPVMNERIRQHSETIETLAEDHPVVVLSHQGRPTRDDFLSLKHHAELIDKHIEPDLEFQSGLYHGSIEERIAQMDKGDVILLENTRFSSEEAISRSPEDHSDSHLVNKLSEPTDFFVNDAFEVCHRSHATVVGFNPKMESYAGPVLMKELRNNGKIKENDEGSTKMLLGGSKPSDVLRVMDALGDEAVDEFLMGGVPAKLFLKAQGKEIGKDPVARSSWSQNRSSVLKILQKHSNKITLPSDLARGETRVCEPSDNLSSEAKYMDVGDETARKYVEKLQNADSVYVKGAPGMFEKKPFRHGTETILEHLSGKEAYTVVGGGDTANALEILGIRRDRFDHVSLAGGAYVRSLTGEKLPGIEALKRFQN